MYSVKHMDGAAVLRAAQETKGIVWPRSFVIGGLGGAVGRIPGRTHPPGYCGSECGLLWPIRRNADLRRCYGLTVQSIVSKSLGGSDENSGIIAAEHCHSAISYSPPGVYSRTIWKGAAVSTGAFSLTLVSVAVQLVVPSSAARDGCTSLARFFKVETSQPLQGVWV
jgi:hypothetical protein